MSDELSQLGCNRFSRLQVCWTVGMLSRSFFTAAAPNDSRLQRADGSLVLLPARFDALRLDSGDLFVIWTGRGRGWREPYPRDPEVAARDVRNALISVERARGLNSMLVAECPVRLDVVATEQIRAASRPEPE